MSDLDYVEPLLSPPTTPTYGTASEQDHPQTLKPARSIEDDVVPETAVVGRTIGWGSAYIIVISRVIGSGIFAMPGAIVMTVGSPGLALLMWVIGAFVAWCGLAITLEYGCMLPRSGGEKVYLEYTFRRPRFLASTLVAVQAVLLGFTASNCIVFAKYTLFALKFEPSDAAVKALAAGLLTAITIVHGCFYKSGIWIQNILGWAKVVLIIFMILTGFFVVAFRRKTEPSAQNINLGFAVDDWWGGSNWSWSILSTAFFKIFYSYAGLGNINNVLNEVKNPVRTLKTVEPVALLTACVMYLLVNLAYFSVVPIEDIKQSGELIAALFFERVFGPGFGNVSLPLAIAVSAAGNVMVVTFSLVSHQRRTQKRISTNFPSKARVNQEVARQGFLPFASCLASSRPYNAPMGGLIVHYVPSLLVIVLPPSADVYAFIADVEGYAGQFFAVATSAGLLWLRYKKPDLYRPFKAWIPGVWLRIALCIGLIAAPFFPPKHGTGDVGFFYATYALVGLGV